MNRTLASIVIIAALVFSTGCGGLFQRGEPTQNAHTAIRLGSVGWNSYVRIERARCDKNKDCLATLAERNTQAKEILRVATQHVKDIELAIEVGDKVKAGKHLDALEELVTGLDPEHFRDTSELIGSMRRQIAEIK